MAACSPLCVQCWRGPKCVLEQRLVRVADGMTLLEVFSAEVQPRLSADVTSVAWTVVASASSNGGSGTWKEVEVTENVQLVLDFGCRFVLFRLDGVAPAAKRPCVENQSAFDVLLKGAAKQDKLPAAKGKTTKDTLFTDIVDHLKVSSRTSRACLISSRVLMFVHVAVWRPIV